MLISLVLLYLLFFPSIYAEGDEKNIRDIISLTVIYILTICTGRVIQTDHTGGAQIERCVFCVQSAKILQNFC